MNDLYALVERLDEEIAQLPAGYISKKNIRGKVQYYLQWKENGKLKSKYVRESGLPELETQIERRKRLQAKRKELMNMLPKNGAAATYETSVMTGERLMQYANKVRGFEKRDMYGQLRDYVSGPDWNRVCVVYGLRRTGKTTMLLQAVADMTEEQASKAFYLKAQRTDTMAAVNRDLNRLYDEGYRYAFIDEVTLIKDFVDSAALFSDVFAPMGMKVVLSGTDSLSFWLAQAEELYDRARMIHTTFIPYREYSRLLGIDGIDQYIRYGGTLRAGEIDFDDKELNAEDASFRDDESTRRYIDTAICKNIQHSLECYEHGSHFRHLYALYEADELTGAINRIIEDMNHRFVLKVLEKDFESADLGITRNNLRKERDPEKRTTILDNIDTAAVTERLMKILDIRNQDRRTVNLTETHINEIREYLKALDLILDCPIEYAESGIEPEEHILFTQPGMRYCQAEALVHSIRKDDLFSVLSEHEREYVADRLLEEVRGRMLEDIVLLETSKALDKKRYRVFKLRFHRGEYDMVIYDRDKDCCAAYEIKHSKEVVPEQARHLTDEAKLSLLEHRFGEITERVVLYLGDPQEMDNGVEYRNAEQYLKALPEFEMRLTMSDAPVEEHSEAEGPFFTQSM